jgi:hypothetical protein
VPWLGRIGRFLPVVGLLIARRAGAAPETTPITDSNYSIELYDGVAIGNAAVVGMGGATVALASGTAGTLFNASAPAVKLTTDTDHWNWDYHLDYLNGSLSTDYDNNGSPVDHGRRDFTTVGIGGRIGEWAAAFTFTDQTAPVDATVPVAGRGDVPLVAATDRLQFAVARFVPRIDTAIGVSVTKAIFDFSPDCSGAGCESLFSISGTGLELGATWAPRGQSFRIGTALSTPIYGGDVTGCDPNDCAGWILPHNIVSAPRIAVGGAYRFAATDWNQLVGGWFRDEKAVTVASDVVVTDSIDNAFGLEAFGTHMLQRSGRHPSVSVRVGTEYEWLPGRLRVRGGSYWEPSRYVGVPGRLHITFGLELRVFEVTVFGKPHRGRITLTSDAANHFSNSGVSVGFWH